MNIISRKSFLQSLIGIPFLPAIKFSGNSKSLAFEPEPYQKELVKEFVITAHGGKNEDLNKIKSMVVEYPNIVHGSHDWGNGDFETAIEGAGHMGNVDIANFLIESGSRANMFVLAMLGKSDLVISFLDNYPKQIFANGPHGFTLLHHARKAGDGGLKLVNYLVNKGLTETFIKIK